MPTHIDDVSSEIVTTPAPAAGDKSGGDSRWKEAERIERTIEHRKGIVLRTKAEGFDD